MSQFAVRSLRLSLNPPLLCPNFPAHEHAASNRFSNNVKEIAALPEGGGACLVILSLVSAFMAASSIGINGGPILPK